MPIQIGTPYTVPVSYRPSAGIGLDTGTRILAFIIFILLHGKQT